MAAAVSSSSSQVAFTCKVCYKQATLTCGICLKALYCSEPCVNGDLSKHKLACIPHSKAMGQQCIKFLAGKNGFGLFTLFTEKIENAFTYIDFDKKTFSFHYFNPAKMEVTTIFPDVKGEAPPIPEKNLKDIFIQTTLYNKKERMTVAYLKTDTLYFASLPIPPSTF